MSIDTEACYKEAFNLFLGDRLGRGMSRDVYTCTVRKDLVVKVEYDETRSRFQNIQEYQFWESIQFTPFVKWFAPVESISPDGRILLMKRTEPIPKNKLPKMLPSLLNDTKPANYGYFEGRVVCHDYGLVPFNMSLRLKKVNWNE